MKGEAKIIMGKAHLVGYYPSKENSMPNEMPVESASASAPLQTTPIITNCAPYCTAAVPLTAAAVLAATDLRIVAHYAESRKAVTYTAAVTTTSGVKPTGTVTFKAGSTVLGKASLVSGKVSTKVKVSAIRDVVTAIYSGDEGHASSSDEYSHTPTIANPADLDVLGPRDSRDPPTSYLNAPDADADSTETILNPDELSKAEGLRRAIKSAWTSHEISQSAVRMNRLGLAHARVALGRDLSSYKDLLVKTGRNGKWAGFLRALGIPDTTAERYIDNWKKSMGLIVGKLPSGALQGPSKEELACLVKTLTAKAKRVLTTDESIAQFLLDIAAALRPAASSEDSDTTVK
jgi:hypothetical protein